MDVSEIQPPGGKQQPPPDVVGLPCMGMEGGSASQKASQEQTDVHAARCVSIISLVASLIVAALGLGLGITEETLSLIGFGGEALLDGISSIMVLWRFKKPKVREFADAEAAQAAKEARDRVRERNSGIGMGGVFIFTSIALLVSATLKGITFDAEHHVEEERTAMLWGHLLAWPSAAIFTILAVVKHRLSKALRSQVLAKDALCSLLGALLALICAVAALVEQFASGSPVAVMVVDIAAGTVIALILFTEGARMLVHNLSTQTLQEYEADDII